MTSEIEIESKTAFSKSGNETSVANSKDRSKSLSAPKRVPYGSKKDAEKSNEAPKLLHRFGDAFVQGMVSDLQGEKKKKRKRRSMIRREKPMPVLHAPISFGSSFKMINSKEPQPREMMIRASSDFSLPLNLPGHDQSGYCKT